MTPRPPASTVAAVLGAVTMAILCGGVTMYAVFHTLNLAASVGAGSTALWVWIAVTDAARFLRDDQT